MINLKIGVNFVRNVVALMLFLVLCVPLPALALNKEVSVKEYGGGPIYDVRGTYVMNYVMTIQPTSNHVNSIYVIKDGFNMLELGWCWWGPSWIYGSTSSPAWFVHVNDGSEVNWAEYTSDGQIISGVYTSGVNALPGRPTTGTNYGFKIENNGFNSKTWYAKVNNYTKYTRTYANFAYGRSIIGSERQHDSDSNYAHFWSCQRIPNLSGQSWTNWQTPDLFSDNDPAYYWNKISATEHYVQQ